jgi:hypothetical protein
MTDARLYYVIRAKASGNYLSTKEGIFGPPEHARLFQTPQSARELLNSYVEAAHRAEFEVVTRQVYT